eukprot:TRINITY_DN5263_c0_g1_i1.p1 TRINITY_DN5263_c0_g1~~TRINITY_DN5263_c0_g1_i1.p1  ORF type:complete len:2198 (+),score=617.74 TRINITY_DN5263_c0_g1_i1:180-6773(+)
MYGYDDDDEDDSDESDDDIVPFASFWGNEQEVVLSDEDPGVDGAVRETLQRLDNCPTSTLTDPRKGSLRELARTRSNQSGELNLSLVQTAATAGAAPTVNQRFSKAVRQVVALRRISRNIGLYEESVADLLSGIRPKLDDPAAAAGGLKKLREHIILSRDSAEEAVESGGIDLIFECLDLHPLDEGVAKAACDLINLCAAQHVTASDPVPQEVMYKRLVPQVEQQLRSYAAQPRRHGDSVKETVAGVVLKVTSSGGAGTVGRRDVVSMCSLLFDAVLQGWAACSKGLLLTAIAAASNVCLDESIAAELAATTTVARVIARALRYVSTSVRPPRKQKQNAAAPEPTPKAGQTPPLPHTHRAALRSDEQVGLVEDAGARGDGSTELLAEVLDSIEPDEEAAVGTNPHPFGERCNTMDVVPDEAAPPAGSDRLNATTGALNTSMATLALSASSDQDPSAPASLTTHEHEGVQSPHGAAPAEVEDGRLSWSKPPPLHPCASPAAGSCLGEALSKRERELPSPLSGYLNGAGFSWSPQGAPLGTPVMLDLDDTHKKPPSVPSTLLPAAAVQAQSPRWTLSELLQMVESAVFVVQVLTDHPASLRVLGSAQGMLSLSGALYWLTMFAGRKPRGNGQLAMLCNSILDTLQAGVALAAREAGPGETPLSPDAGIGHGAALGAYECIFPLTAVCKVLVMRVAKRRRAAASPSAKRGPPTLLSTESLSLLQEDPARVAEDVEILKRIVGALFYEFLDGGTGMCAATSGVFRSAMTWRPVALYVYEAVRSGKILSADAAFLKKCCLLMGKLAGGDAQPLFCDGAGLLLLKLAHRCRPPELQEVQDIAIGVLRKMVATLTPAPEAPGYGSEDEGVASGWRAALLVSPDHTASTVDLLANLLPREAKVHALALTILHDLGGCEAARGAMQRRPVVAALLDVLGQHALPPALIAKAVSTVCVLLDGAAVDWVGPTTLESLVAVLQRTGREQTGVQAACCRLLALLTRHDAGKRAALLDAAGHAFPTYLCVSVLGGQPQTPAAVAPLMLLGNLAQDAAWADALTECNGHDCVVAALQRCHAVPGVLPAVGWFAAALHHAGRLPIAALEEDAAFAEALAAAKADRCVLDAQQRQQCAAVWDAATAKSRAAADEARQRAEDKAAELADKTAAIAALEATVAALESRAAGAEDKAAQLAAATKALESKAAADTPAAAAPPAQGLPPWVFDAGLSDSDIATLRTFAGGGGDGRLLQAEEELQGLGLAPPALAALQHAIDRQLLLRGHPPRFARMTSLPHWLQGTAQLSTAAKTLLAAHQATLLEASQRRAEVQPVAMWMGDALLRLTARDADRVGLSPADRTAFMQAAEAEATRRRGVKHSEQPAQGGLLRAKSSPGGALGRTYSDIFAGERDAALAEGQHRRMQEVIAERNEAQQALAEAQQQVEILREMAEGTPEAGPAKTARMPHAASRSGSSASSRTRSMSASSRSSSFSSVSDAGASPKKGRRRRAGKQRPTGVAGPPAARGGDQAAGGVVTPRGAAAAALEDERELLLQRLREVQGEAERAEKGRRDAEDRAEALQLQVKELEGNAVPTLTAKLNRLDAELAQHVETIGDLEEELRSFKELVQKLPLAEDEVDPSMPSYTDLLAVSARDKVDREVQQAALEDAQNKLRRAEADLLAMHVQLERRDIEAARADTTLKNVGEALEAAEDRYREATDAQVALQRTLADIEDCRAEHQALKAEVETAKHAKRAQEQAEWAGAAAAAAQRREAGTISRMELRFLELHDENQTVMEENELLQRALAATRAESKRLADKAAKAEGNWKAVRDAFPWVEVKHDVIKREQELLKEAHCQELRTLAERLDALQEELSLKDRLVCSIAAQVEGDGAVCVEYRDRLQKACQEVVALELARSRQIQLDGKVLSQAVAERDALKREMRRARREQSKLAQMLSRADGASPRSPPRARKAVPVPAADPCDDETHPGEACPSDVVLDLGEPDASALRPESEATGVHGKDAPTHALLSTPAVGTQQRPGTSHAPPVRVKRKPGATHTHMSLSGRPKTAGGSVDPASQAAALGLPKPKPKVAVPRIFAAGSFRQTPDVVVVEGASTAASSASPLISAPRGRPAEAAKSKPRRAVFDTSSGPAAAYNPDTDKHLEWYRHGKKRSASEKRRANHAFKLMAAERGRRNHEAQARARTEMDWMMSMTLIESDL